MGEKIYIVIRNLMLTWVVFGIIPGIDPKYGPTSLLIVGLLFGIIIVSLPGILKFFKFPVNFWGRFLIGTLFTLLLFLVLNTWLKTLIVFGSGYLGNYDLIVFTIPKLLTLPNAFAVIMTSAIILNLFSILLSKLAKTES